MADKIVILEDENGNNIYPITRGLAADSVDTNAIQDGAVTSSKIDSATLKKIAYMPGDVVDVSGEYLIHLYGRNDGFRIFVTSNKSLDFVSGASIRFTATQNDYSIVLVKDPTALPKVATTAFGTDIVGSIRSNMIGFLVPMSNGGSITDLYGKGIITANGLKITFS